MGRSRATIRRSSAELHGYRPAGVDDHGRTVCQCGRLWEDRCHVHDVRTYDGPRVLPEPKRGRRRV